MVLARMLSPEDYGINAMAVSITGFANVFASLGLSTATVQRAQINHEQVSTLFWINAAIGLLVTLIVAAMSPAVSRFYNSPELLRVMLLLSTVFLITALSIQHSALLTRQMRFYTIAKIRIFSLVAGITVAIVAGYYGFGYWALVFNTLTSAIVSAIANWIACRWVPGLPHRNVGVGSMVKFGADLVGFDVLNYFSRNLDNILIGRYLGAGPLGLYSKAYQLLMMPITNLRGPVNSVAMPALGRLQQDPAKFRDYYLKCVELLAFVSMPLVMFMFVYTEQLIDLLLGPQWLEVVGIFKILAIGAFIQPVASTSGLVLITTGQSRLYLKLGAISSAFICASFVVGLSWGVKGVATSYIVATYLLVIPRMYYSFRNTSVSLSLFVGAVYRPVAASLITGFGIFFILQKIVIANAFLSLLVGVILSTMVYFVVFALLPNGFGGLREYLSYGRSIVEKSK